jgi:hypothetical protein
VELLEGVLLALTDKDTLSETLRDVDTSSVGVTAMDMLLDRVRDDVALTDTLTDGIHERDDVTVDDAEPLPIVAERSSVMVSERLDVLLMLLERETVFVSEWSLVMELVRDRDRLASLVTEAVTDEVVLNVSDTVPVRVFDASNVALGEDVAVLFGVSVTETSADEDTEKESDGVGDGVCTGDGDRDTV